MQFRSAIISASVAFLSLSPLPLTASARAQTDAAATQPAAAAPDSPSTDLYIRTVRVNPTTLRLDIAVRAFSPREGSGPSILMAGAIHIADPDFYRLLIDLLSSQDLVLYEGVKPRGTIAADALDDAGRVRKTESGIRFVAIMLERFRQPDGDYVPSLDALAQAVEQQSTTQAKWLRSSFTDAWGHPLDYERRSGMRPGFMLRSLGADGKEGGAGTDADLNFSSQKPLSKQETGGEPGIQSRLAHALGLSFQLEQMDMDRPNFRNSDMTLDQVEDAVAARGGDAGILLGMLDGSSALAGVMKFGLAIIEKNPRLQTMTKVILLQTFRVSESRFEDLSSLPPAMAGLFEAIIKDRNQVVVDDLKAALADATPASSLAVVYGAGHLPDLELKLADQLGYVPRATFWLPAITVDVSAVGMTAEELDGLEKMFEMRR